MAVESIVSVMGPMAAPCSNLMLPCLSRIMSVGRSISLRFVQRLAVSLAKVQFAPGKLFLKAARV